MRQVKRWRYYCDHCRKAGGSKGHMASHERGCTNNPGRTCRICALAGFKALPLAELVSFARGIATSHPGPTEDSYAYCTIDAVALQELRTRAGGCPVCTFAAMRQAQAFPEYSVDFKLKDELAPVWEQINESREAAENSRGYY